MQQGERKISRGEGLARDVQHRARILADRVEHHGIAEGRDDLPQDEDRLRLEGPELRRHLEPSGLPGHEVAPGLVEDAAEGEASALLVLAGVGGPRPPRSLGTAGRSAVRRDGSGPLRSRHCARGLRLWASAGSRCGAPSECQLLVSDDDDVLHGEGMKPLESQIGAAWFQSREDAFQRRPIIRPIEVDCHGVGDHDIEGFFFQKVEHIGDAERYGRQVPDRPCRPRSRDAARSPPCRSSPGTSRRI